MTLQEAQTKFAGIVASITSALTSAQLVQKQAELQAVLDACPNTTEFDPITSAIADLSPKLAGQVTQVVLTDLQGRLAGLNEAVGLLSRTSKRAEADARMLTFEKPKTVVAALTESVNTLKEIRGAAKAGDFTAVAPKVEALLVLLEQVKASAKVG
jgi:hypothetical protein